jgi:nucleoside-diphosphate-sugar epimerase
MSRTILILGGTAWVGRELAAQAVARGDTVYCLARGESGPVAEGSRLIRADRNDRYAYETITDREWDNVYEVSWQPRHVRLAAEALAGKVEQWTYISTVSVYAPADGPLSENSALHEPVDEDTWVEGSQYAGAKVRCELETVASHPEALLVRAGVIAGPGDPTERFAYWPRRASQAGAEPMLTPGAPACPMQVVDIRDLVAWVLDASGKGMSGAVNVTGESMEFADAVARIRAAVGATGDVVEADPAWLAEQGVQTWKGVDSLPLWVHEDGRARGIGRHTHHLYEASGGKIRPFEDTVADVLADERALGIDRPVGGGLTRARELELIEAWRARA